MGARGHIYVNTITGGGVYLYTHWQGNEVNEILANALDRGRSRWGDPRYLARIIFSEMIKDDVMGTRGYGIDTILSDDNEYPVPFVYTQFRQVMLGLDTWSFEEFVKKFATRKDEPQ